VVQKAICESQRINDTIEDNLQGAFAFLRTHLYKKMPGSPYAPFYFIAETGMFASFFSSVEQHRMRKLGPTNDSVRT